MNRTEKSQQTTTALHVARYYSWHPETRRRRTIHRKTIRFRNPAQFVSDCQDLARNSRPQHFSVIGVQGNHVAFWGHFGTSQKGVQYLLEVEVTWPQGLMLDGYLRGQYGTKALCTLIEVQDKSEDEDDGGESVIVPSAADSLANTRALPREIESSPKPLSADCRSIDRRTRPIRKARKYVS